MGISNEARRPSSMLRMETLLMGFPLVVHTQMGSVNIYDIYVDVCRQHPHDATHYMHEIGRSRHPHAHWARKMADEKYVNDME